MSNSRTDDRQEIQDLLYRYCRAVDRGDNELVLTCYHDDAIDNHGPFCGSPVDFVAAVCDWAAETYDSMMHCLGNIFIEFDTDDRAFVESYFVGYHMRRPSGEPAILEILAGRYVDRFERRNGEWRIANRVVVHEWGDTRSVEVEYPDSRLQFQQGGRAHEDVAYTQRQTA